MLNKYPKTGTPKEEGMILHGDALEQLEQLPNESVDCCVTSPPYYALRDYGTGEWVGGNPNCPHRRMSKYSAKTMTGHKQKELRGNVGDAIYKDVCPLCGAVRVDKQIGLEETPALYIERLTQVFHEVKRVLKPDGTLWLNIGDSYNGSGRGRNADGEVEFTEASSKQKTNRGSQEGVIPNKTVTDSCKSKDLIGIPWMLAFALRDDGWYLRQDIIWHKPNPMPESVKDRCTKSHEYIFLLSKSRIYYFNYEAIQEDISTADEISIPEVMNAEKRNKRDVWTVSTKPVREAHFATFPEELIEPCILAGTKVGGVVLDPFFGSGTTGRVATRLNRDYIGIELNEEYIKIANKRANEVQLSFEGLI